MKKFLALMGLGVVTAAVVVACGGGGGTPPTLAVASDTTLTASAPVVQSVANVPFTFNSGVPALGTTTATTVTVTPGTGATPGFKVDTPTGSATGTMSFGSCIFAVSAVTGTVGNLKIGSSITVNPCNMSVNTTGAVANGVATSRSVALVLGAASSAGATVTVGVNPGGQLTLNGNQVGTVTLVPVSGSGG